MSKGRIKRKVEVVEIDRGCGSAEEGEGGEEMWSQAKWWLNERCTVRVRQPG